MSDFLCWSNVELSHVHAVCKIPPVLEVSYSKNIPAHLLNDAKDVEKILRQSAFNWTFIYEWHELLELKVDIEDFVARRSPRQPYSRTGTQKIMLFIPKVERQVPKKQFHYHVCPWSTTLHWTFELYHRRNKYEYVHPINGQVLRNHSTPTKTNIIVVVCSILLCLL